MNIVKGFKDTIQWYNENAASYAKTGKNLFFIPGIEKFVSYLPPSASILDAGCGSGRDSALLQSKGFNVVGVDISEGLINEAKKQYPDIKFVVGDLLNLSFSENSFDGVWAHASLVHLENPEDTQRALTEFYRVLKPEGIIHIFVKEQVGEKKTDVVSDVLSNHERFFQYYTKEEMTKVLEDVGFEIVFIQNAVPDPSGRQEIKWIWAIAKKVVV